MSVQITVRIADESAEHLDKAVAEGPFTSRADYLNWLLRKDAQHKRAVSDLRRLHASGALPDPYPELDGLAAYAATVPLDVD